MSGPILGGKLPLPRQPWVQKLLARTTPFTAEEAGWAARRGGAAAINSLRNCTALDLIPVGLVERSKRLRLYKLVLRAPDPNNHLRLAARELSGNDTLYKEK